MNNASRRTILAGLLASGLPRVAHASGWPEKNITLIVPYPAGGGSDAFARPVAAAMADRFARSVVVENRSGAGGTVGTTTAALAPADGYTLLLGDTGLTYAPLVYSHAKFDFARDFTPISALARVSYVLIVNPARLGAASLVEFMETARRRPGYIDMGVAGLGSVTHLALELFEQQAGVELHHVPYRGGAPMLQDLVAGQIAAAFVVAGAAAPYVQSGSLRALAVANRRREPLLPGVPTMDEAGLANFRARIWFGLFAPRQTPDVVLDQLHAAVQVALKDPKIEAVWSEQGARVELESRRDFARFVAADSERWARIARQVDVKLE